MSGLLQLGRRLGNRALDALFLPPLDRLWVPRLRGRVLCLLYHRVDEPGRMPFLDAFGVPPIRPEDLHDELALLGRRGARFLTFADLREGRFPDPDQFGVIVSFDDGFQDTYRHGLPVLDGLGVQATVFQASALVEAEDLIWEHALYWYGHDPRLCAELSELAHRRIPRSRTHTGMALITFLREEVRCCEVEALLVEMKGRHDHGPRLRDLAAAIYPRRETLQAACRHGHEIGSHGHRHYPRRNLSDGEFEQELQVSSWRLASLLGGPPRAYSYPFNSHQPGDERICGRHFLQAATVDGALIGPDSPPLELPRFTWPGPHRHGLHRRRWLMTGHL